MTIKETIKAAGYALGNIAKKPATVMYPNVPLPVEKRSRGMLSLDLENCIGCELCFKICPADAIRMTKLDVHYPKNARDEAPAIDFNKCIFCGLCSEICPPLVLHHTHKFDISTSKREDLEYTPQELKQVYLDEYVAKIDEYEKPEGRAALVGGAAQKKPDDKAPTGKTQAEGTNKEDEQKVA